MIDRAQRFVDVVARCKITAGLLMFDEGQDYIPSSKKNEMRLAVQRLNRRKKYTKRLRAEVTAYRDNEKDPGSFIYLTRLLSLSDSNFLEAIDVIYDEYTKKSVQALAEIAAEDQLNRALRNTARVFPALHN